MNRLSQAALFSALILSGYSSTCFASYYFHLKQDGALIGATANLDDSGGGTFTVPAGALGASSPSLTFSIPSSLQSSQVYMWKPGTDGQNECLDMGVNAAGLSVSGLPDTTARYALTLSVVSDINANCANQSNPPPIRTASINGINGTDFNWAGQYHFYNIVSAVPEPGSLALLGLGLGALVFVKRRRTERS